MSTIEKRKTSLRLRRRNKYKIPFKRYRTKNYIKTCIFSTLPRYDRDDVSSKDPLSTQTAETIHDTGIITDDEVDTWIDYICNSTIVPGKKEFIFFSIWLIFVHILFAFC